jgi:hypothetical protein
LLVSSILYSFFLKLLMATETFVVSSILKINFVGKKMMDRNRNLDCGFIHF